MPSVLALSPIGMQAKASPLAAHRPTATPTTPTNGASVVQPKVVAQSAGAKIAQKGVPIPQQLTVKPKVVPTMTAIRPIAQQSQQPRAPRPIAVETKVPATQPPKPSVTKPAVTKPIVTKPPAATATTPTAAAASSSSSNGAVAPVMVAITQGGQTVYEEDDSDPNRLWCFCRMPHTPVCIHHNFLFMSSYSSYHIILPAFVAILVCERKHCCSPHASVPLSYVMNQHLNQSIARSRLTGSLVWSLSSIGEMNEATERVLHQWLLHTRILI